MKRSAVLSISLLGVLGGSPAGAQQTGKTYRVGILTRGTLAYDRQHFLPAFLRTLARLGYLEGKNLEIVYRGAGGDLKLLPALATELVRAKPDVIVAHTTPVIAAAQRATSSIPIVMADNGDPVGAGFIASLARPGGNITGPTNMNLALVGKRLQLLKELVPHLRRVVVVRNPSNPAHRSEWQQVESAAHTFGIAVVALDIRAADEIVDALNSVQHLGADAMLVLADSATSEDAALAVRLVAKQRLPAVYGVDPFTAAGGLMYCGIPEAAIWSQAATYVARIFKGANPADLPVAQPTVFELVVNLKAAREIGITVPQSILLRATEVIK
jgi:putative tryptophan/tyrosine transport system substrate-binding protein